jgi:hypothetical protein
LLFLIYHKNKYPSAKYPQNGGNSVPETQNSKIPPPPEVEQTERTIVLLSVRT